MELRSYIYVDDHFARKSNHNAKPEPRPTSKEKPARIGDQLVKISKQQVKCNFCHEKIGQLCQVCSNQMLHPVQVEVKYTYLMKRDLEK